VLAIVKKKKAKTW